MTRDSRQIPLREGSQLDCYAIEGVLGMGGFGVTYRAKDLNLDKTVAIKEYLPLDYARRAATSAVEALPDSVDVFDWGLSRFKDEARTLAMFRHPSIVPVLRFIPGNGTGYLVMEYEEGMELGRWASQYPERLDSRFVVQQLLLPLLDGLQQVHEKGILHRDIKPSNVLVRADHSPVLIDFGSARPDGGTSNRNLTSLVSFGYSPPEQYGSISAQGPWSDLYALAGTLYRVVAGNPPNEALKRQYGEEHVSAARVGAGRYPPAFLETIDKALSLDIGARPQNAVEFRDSVLRPVAKVSKSRGSVDPADQTRIAGARIPAAKPAESLLARRASAAVIALIGGVGAVAVGAGTYVWMSRPSPEQQGEQLPPSPVQDENLALAEDEAEDELSITDVFAMPQDTLEARRLHIDFAIEDYVSIRERWDECRRAQCEDLASLQDELFASQEAPWAEGGFEGTIRLLGATRTTSPTCSWRVRVEETLRYAATGARQARTYCTADGANGTVESEEEVIALEKKDEP